MNDPLAFLRATHAATERDAQDSADEPWRAVDTPFGPEVHIGTGDDVDGKWSRESLGVDAAYRCDDPHDDCGDARHAYRAEGRLIATHAHPAAVLRRIAADRKLIALHDMAHECSSTDWISREHDPCCWIPESETCDTIRALAEGWGWTEETTA